MSIENIIKEATEKMNNTVEALKKEFATMRTSRATPALLEKVMVNYYGTETPIQHVASISAPDAKTLVIKPHDKNLLSEIEKAIQKSDLGLNPQNDGNFIRLPIPPLTEERRNELVKLAKKKAEDFRISIRNIRRDANDAIKALEKKSEITQDQSKKATEKIQKLTDEYIEKINQVYSAKEKEILGK